MSSISLTAAVTTTTLPVGGALSGYHHTLCRKYWECRKVPKVASSAGSETQRRQIRRAPMEVCGVLEGLAEPQHVALGERLADDLHADGQAAGLAGGHGEA